jgi:hypothetical protein
MAPCASIPAAIRARWSWLANGGCAAGFFTTTKTPSGSKGDPKLIATITPVSNPAAVIISLIWFAYRDISGSCWRIVTETFPRGDPAMADKNAALCSSVTSLNFCRSFICSNSSRAAAASFSKVAARSLAFAAVSFALAVAVALSDNFRSAVRVLLPDSVAPKDSQCANERQNRSYYQRCIRPDVKNRSRKFTRV